MKLTLKTLSLMIIFVLLLSAFSAPVSAGAVTPDDPITATPKPNNPYFSSTTVENPGGVNLEVITINGPPTPPPGFEEQRAPVAAPKPDEMMSTKLLNVPAYNWVYGCSAVSASMIAGYYDNNGFPNLYTGPANGGVSPMDSSIWPTWRDSSGYLYPNNPLIASHNGVDGRVGRGSLDDYWLSLNSLSDPFLTGGWSEHTYGTAIGDYMKTSQAAYNLPDGATRFWGYGEYPLVLTCTAMQEGGLQDDGTLGRKLFYEARGYTVSDCYNQSTDNIAQGGFSFAQYKAEIDAGSPVLINLKGHSVVGVGYDTTNNVVYLHDTWDYNNHSMYWGGSYSGMEMLSVSIVHLGVPLPLPGDFSKSEPSNNASAQPTTPTLKWAGSSNASSYDYCLFDASTASSCSTWTPVGTSTSVQPSLLQNGKTYKWQVRANNTRGTTYANGSASALWTFTTVAAAPAAFGKLTPETNATGISTSATLDWQDSGGATEYFYCIDKNINNACDAGWVSTGTISQAPVSELDHQTIYEWQAKATNSADTVYGDGSPDLFWKFTTVSPSDPPAAFNKLTPLFNAKGILLDPELPLLDWENSAGAEEYFYCIDPQLNGVCDGTWLSTSTDSQVWLSGLMDGTTYEWQVKAVNANGTTYANQEESAYWRFTSMMKLLLPTLMR